MHHFFFMLCCDLNFQILTVVKVKLDHLVLWAYCCTCICFFFSSWRLKMENFETGLLHSWSTWMKWMVVSCHFQSSISRWVCRQIFPFKKKKKKDKHQKATVSLTFESFLPQSNLSFPNLGHCIQNLDYTSELAAMYDRSTGTPADWSLPKGVRKIEVQLYEFMLTALSTCILKVRFSKIFIPSLVAIHCVCSSFPLPCNRSNPSVAERWLSLATLTTAVI